MANPKKVELGKAFVQRLLEKIPEDKREAAAALLNEHEDALETLGDGVLRQEDYSRVRTQQTDWWNANKEKLTEFDRLKAEGKITDPNPNPNPNPNPAVDTSKLLTKDEFLEQGRLLERESLSLNAMISNLSVSHYIEFGKPLDVEELVGKALEAGKPIRQFYNEQVAADRATKQKTEYDKAIADAETRGAAKAREAMMKEGHASAPPYPIGSTAPSTLDGLRKDDNAPAKHTVDAAVGTLIEEMNKAQAST